MYNDVSAWRVDRPLSDDRRIGKYWVRLLLGTLGVLFLVAYVEPYPLPQGETEASVSPTRSDYLPDSELNSTRSLEYFSLCMATSVDLPCLLWIK